MEAPEGAVKTVKDFAKGSYRLVKRCTKPDRKGACLRRDRGSSSSMLESAALPSHRGRLLLKRSVASSFSAVRSVLHAAQHLHGNKRTILA